MVEDIRTCIGFLGGRSTKCRENHSTDNTDCLYNVIDQLLVRCIPRRINVWDIYTGRLIRLICLTAVFST